MINYGLLSFRVSPFRARQTRRPISNNYLNDLIASKTIGTFIDARNLFAAVGEFKTLHKKKNMN